MGLEVNRIEKLSSKEKADVRQLINRLRSVHSRLSFGGDGYENNEESFVDELRWIKFYLEGDLKWLLESPKKN